MVVEHCPGLPTHLRDRPTDSFQQLERFLSILHRQDMQLLSAATSSAKHLLRSSSRWQRCHSHTLHRSISTDRHDLLDPSPFIRLLAPRPIAPPPSQPSPTDFTIYPNFLNHEEQAALITLALWKLDRVDSRKKRRRRRRVGDDPIINQDTRQESLSTHDQLQSLFEADSEYGFEEVRSLFLVSKRPIPSPRTPTDIFPFFFSFRATSIR
jgi:hypothetical protein